MRGAVNDRGCPTGCGSGHVDFGAREAPAMQRSCSPPLGLCTLPGRQWQPVHDEHGPAFVGAAAVKIAIQVGAED